jgi:hypothetical protein
MHTSASFRSSAFNATEARPYFINPSCFGDDLARWLIARLREAGVKTDDEPGQEDFGWYFDFEVQGCEHCCVLGYRPGEPDGMWLLWIERARGLVGSMLGLRNRGIRPAAVDAVNTVLSKAAEVHSLRWESLE